MRVSSLIALLILAAVVVLAIIFRGYVFEKVDSYYQWSSGYKPAETPTEALEKFREAIQARKYKWAATYVTKDYADMLIKANDGAQSLGAEVDQVRNYMNNKGLERDKTVVALYYLDPFPTTFKVAGVPKTVSDTRAVGLFAWEPVPVKTGNVNPSDFGSLDTRMFTCALVHPALKTAGGVAIVKDGSAWKIDPPTLAAHVETVRYFMDRWKTYHTTLGRFRRDMNNERWDSPQKFESEVLSVLQEANPK